MLLVLANSTLSILIGRGFWEVKGGDLGKARRFDKIGRPYHFQSMTTAALLLKEIETMLEETALKLLDFALFMKGRHIQARPAGTAKLTSPR
jgi:hypothetical protein